MTRKSRTASCSSTSSAWLSWATPRPSRGASTAPRRSPARWRPGAAPARRRRPSRRSVGRARAVFAAALAAAAFGAVLSLLAPMRWYAGGVPAALVLYLPPAAFCGSGPLVAWCADESWTHPRPLWSLVCGPLDSGLAGFAHIGGGDYALGLERCGSCNGLKAYAACAAVLGLLFRSGGQWHSSSGYKSRTRASG